MNPHTGMIEDAVATVATGVGPGEHRFPWTVTSAVQRGGTSSTLPAMRILFWFREDLRLADNTGLHEAVRDAAGKVVPFYTTESATADPGARPRRQRPGAGPLHA